MSTIRWRRVAVTVLVLLLLPTWGMAGEGEEAQAPPVKQIKMYGENWKWTPKEIRVPVGTKLIIDFESFDASHSFELKDYGIDVPMPEGERARIEFVVDRVGTFKWRCGRPCGDGCPKMRGKLIVEALED